MSYFIKISKTFDKPSNKLSTENNGKSPRKIYIDFESNNLIYDSSDGYSDGYLDGYLEENYNYITLYGKDFYDNEINSTIYINKNGRYEITDNLYSSITKLEGYLNIKDIYEEPCVLSVGEVSPITKRDSELGSVAYVYGESNGDFIISTGN